MHAAVDIHASRIRRRHQPNPTPHKTPSCCSVVRHPLLPLTVGLLEPGAGTGTTELLGLATAVIGHQEGAVEGGEGRLEHVLAVLVDVLLVVGDQGLGDGLAHRVHLRGVAAACDPHADVDLGELVEADNEEGLVDLWE